jgi:hypothetical protein
MNTKNTEDFLLCPTVTHITKTDRGFKSYEILKLTELLESVLDRTATGVNIEFRAQIILKIRNFGTQTWWVTLLSF